MHLSIHSGSMVLESNRMKLVYTKAEDTSCILFHRASCNFLSTKCPAYVATEGKGL